MSTIITTILAGSQEEAGREQWWSVLLDFLDEVLDRPAQRTEELLFRMLLKRCVDGFSRTLEAVLIGDPRCTVYTRCPTSMICYSSAYKTYLISFEKHLCCHVLFIPGTYSHSSVLILSPSDIKKCHGYFIPKMCS